MAKPETTYDQAKGDPIVLQTYRDDQSPDNSVFSDSSTDAEGDEQTPNVKRRTWRHRLRSDQINIISISSCSNISIGSDNENYFPERSATLEETFQGKYQLERTETRNEAKLNEILESNLKVAIDDAELLLRKHRKKGAFINTKAFESAKAKLVGHQLVVISGNPKDGKSAIGFELLNYFSKDDNDIEETKTPIMITTLDELRAVQSYFKHAIIFFDNFLESKKNGQTLGKWEDTFDHIVNITENSSILIIVSLDKHIFTEYEMVLRRYKLFTKDHLIDLSHKDFQLSYGEKKSILLAHLKRMGRNFENLDIDKIASQHQHFGYPLCCVLFAENDHCFQQKENFFEHPLECICKEVDSYTSHDKNKYKYWVLVSVLKCNGISEDIVNLDTQPKSKEMREITKLASKCECDCSLKDFRDSLLSIEDSLIIFNSSTSQYEFSSDIIKEAVFIVYGRIYPEEVIQNVSRHTLHNYIKVDKCDHVCVCLHLQRQHYSFLIKRFLNEIKEGNTSTVAEHVAWRTPGFYKVMYSIVQGKQILHLYNLLYWVLLKQDDNMDFFGSLLEHLDSQTVPSFCCLPNSRQQLLRLEMNACLRHAYEKQNEQAVTLLMGHGVDRDITETAV